LSNVIERSYHLSLDSEVVLPCHLPGHVINAEPSIDRRGGMRADSYDTDNLIPRYPEGIGSVKEAERRLIRQTIVCSGHNLSRAAASLGISRTTLYRKIREYQAETAYDGKSRSKMPVMESH
jgi:transcriptional regulator with PAS, ATPase and Fis domain